MKRRIIRMLTLLKVSGMIYLIDRDGRAIIVLVDHVAKRKRGSHDPDL